MTKSFYEDAVFQTSPGLREFAAWMAMTLLGPDDLHRFDDVLPAGQLDDVADEYRKRSSLWAQMADLIDQLARRAQPEDSDEARG